MHMESYPLLIPLAILIPALGAFINIFWGAKLTERVSGLVGIVAALLSLGVSLLIFAYLNNSHGAAVVVDPAFFDGWLRIESIGLDIPWQFRVDTLTSTMMLVVTGVGSLIHIYAMGYMHGDPKFNRFFAFLNMFLVFMLILVTANNFLMLFVGWEGVGLMSYLLIGFWWDKKGKLGWKNANAARKAMIVNRIGDFGILMAIFLIFWTFGTLNFYAPGETANVPYALEANGYGEAAEEGEHSEGASLDRIVLAAEGGEEAHDEEGGHAALSREQLDNSLFQPEQLGVFGQTAYRMSLPVGDPLRTIDLPALGPTDLGVVLFLILIFMLLGVAGKSAQIPLFVWLPDAMAGPTPVSALIHAATMVTAGVFLMVRSSVFLDFSPEARFIVAMVGALTALMAGFIAMGQWDIKRVLAYSTVSQLGFMVAAVGLGAYVAAIFHLLTHAFFKALLFLGSGSVIHGVEHGHHHVHGHGHGHGDDHGHDDHGHDAHDAHAADHAGEEHQAEFDPQDMRNMGGLASRMPITFVTYLIGTFALAGLPLFAGFWSKDEILLDAWHVGFDKGRLEGYLVLGILLLAAGFTAFYMWRQVQMIFFGTPRSEAAEHAPESSPWMTVVLVILAFFTTFIGLINVPYGFWPFSSVYKPYEFKHFLESSIPSVTQGEALYFNLGIAGLATLVALGAIFFAHSIYAGRRAVRDGNKDPLELDPASRRIFSLANARLYWDEIYFTFIENPYNKLAKFIYEVLDWRFLHDYFHDSVLKRGYDSVAQFLGKPFDLGVIDGVVNGVGTLARGLGERLRGVQTGYVRTYAVALLFGVVAVVVVMLLPLIQNGS